MTDEPVPIKDGEIVAGKYRVGRVLGQGGMGFVVVATHLQLEQRVALKFLLPNAMKSPEVVTRFAREAQAAARIQGEHVARVLDVGQLESGAPYMVMEYLEGEDLEATLVRRGPLPIAEAVGYLLQGCEAVAQAHSLGIVHRDLKPANLFLAKRPGGTPVIKVLDFGISKSPPSVGNPGLTQTTSMFGSPPYMSPEQVTSTRSADARSDIWSLGAVLYELLTFHRPFNGESVPALFVAILHRDPEPPRVHRAEIPPALDVAVMRCLQKDPRSRFPEVAALAAALAPFGPPGSDQSVERIAHMLGLGRRGEPPIALAASGLPTLPSAATYPVVRGVPSRDRSMRVMLVVVALLAVGGAGTAYWFGARGARETSEARTGGSLEGPARVVPVPGPLIGPGLPAPAPPVSPSKVVSARSKPGRRPEPTDDASKAPPARGHASAPSAVCADLLERESLGETLTSKEKAVYAQQCRK
jgi:hypothetical protein